MRRRLVLGVGTPAVAALAAAAPPAVLQDGAATLFVTGGAYALVRTFDVLTERRLIEKSLSRKLVHVLSGVLFMSSWPLFSNSTGARYFAAVVPFLNSMRLLIYGLGIFTDEALVKSVSREGKPEELLRGPFYFVLALLFSVLVFWRESPIGIVSLSMMTGGDGFADIVGRRYGSVKLPFNAKKSWIGSISMFICGFLLSAIMLFYFSSLGYIHVSWEEALGTVLLGNENNVDPGLANHWAARTQATGLWEQFFSTIGVGQKHVKIPLQWADFFTFLLLSPSHFYLARSLLLTPAWDLFGEQSSFVQFSLPEQCPLVNGLSCKTSDKVMVFQPESLDSRVKGKAPVEDTTPTTPPASSSKLPLVDSDLRRSARVKKLSRGFRMTSCVDKQCLGCSVQSPSLSPSVVRNLGSAFCKIGPAKLTKEALLLKKRPMPPIGKKILKKKGDTDAPHEKKSVRRPAVKKPEEASKKNKQ